MKAILYILLGLSLGTGLTLIALQERFLRERRRLLALGESQKAKAGQSQDELNKKWEQECRQHKEELHACQEQLAAYAATPPPSGEEDQIGRLEHERLIQEKNSELSRLATEINNTAALLERHQEEISDLQGQITFLQGELARSQGAEAGDTAETMERYRQEVSGLQGQIISLQAEVARLQETPALPNDDFVLLGNTKGHLLPGSVVRALIKGRRGDGSL